MELGRCFWLWGRHRRRRARGEDARPDLSRALELYRQGIAIKPQFPQLLNGAGLILIEQAKESWERGGDPFTLLKAGRVQVCEVWRQA